MGTFHNDKHALHGITVVVDTKGPYVFVGRCDDMDDREIVLHDVATHKDGQDGKSKAEYVDAVARFGFWKKHETVSIPTNEVASIRRLGEIEVD
ncbi:MAG: hypothetical protein HYR85_13865 [Planctomycetes bacterium]|nr:hypothetical protein [Planctomycetota bacterium]MBI3843571.1 hypothetical protein [Planctomycetota bacterium]